MWGIKCPKSSESDNVLHGGGRVATSWCVLAMHGNTFFLDQDKKVKISGETLTVLTRGGPPWEPQIGEK
jgi:hypothetical protein